MQLNIIFQNPESTRSEIEYARRNGKEILYLEL